MYKKWLKNFVDKRVQIPLKSFLSMWGEIKKACDWFFVNEKSFTGILSNLHKKWLENFVRGSSNPLSCRKYLRKRNLVFYKIYAHKWLCVAFCGHNIFLVTLSWWERVDSNHRSRSNRFTVCPIWPLWNAPIYAFLPKGMELVDGFEPPTCWLQKKAKNGVWKSIRDV